MISRRMFVVIIGGSTLLLVALSAPAEPVSYQGRWSTAPAGAESGWRVQLAQEGSTIVASWTSRDAYDDSPWTYSVAAAQTAPNTFTGTLDRNRTVSVFAAPGSKASGRKPEALPAPGDTAWSRRPEALYPVVRRERQQLGRAMFVFTDDNNGTLTYPGMTRQISRLPETVRP